MTSSDRTSVRWPRRWPLALLALPAGVATWSGWVGLGEMTGFGPVKLLPGIADDFEINSAVTLPIGVEAYAAFALSAWLTSAPVATGTRRFARMSALGALGLGMFGQIAYHLLEVQNEKTAPTAVTVLVSCLPVLVLGLGAALAHMLHRDRIAAATAAEVGVLQAPAAVLDPDPGPGRGTRPVDPAELTPTPAAAGHPVGLAPVNGGQDPDPAPATTPAPRPVPLPVPVPVGQVAESGRPVDPAELTPIPAAAGHPVGLAPVNGGQDPDPAPATTPAPPRPASGPEGQEPAPAAVSGVATMLAAQPSNAAKIRYAIGVLGLDATPGQLSDWLGEWGYAMRTEAIRSELRRARKAAENPDPVATVTPLRGQK
ncbi:hypothetical protein [Planomonospora sp. ID82291]|uniref:hypothetical protein n=1 Tax=Planomonospora sp. ID82291 TaxID=2738136 RepID=UPI0018C3F7C9|nr:hypothetical protein [Planomonospora sp. ID82291]MBG0819115.1 hypothetical protein [Planomonospora sp. ID82291]